MHGVFLVGSFSLVRTLAKIDLVLLERIFSQCGADTSPLQWNRADLDRTIQILDFYNALSLEIQYEIETVLQDIHLLADDAGLERLDRMIGGENRLSGLCDPYYSQAAWAWLSTPDAFCKAAEAQKLAAKTWWYSRRNRYPAIHAGGSNGVRTGRSATV